MSEQQKAAAQRTVLDPETELRQLLNITGSRRGLLTGIAAGAVLLATGCGKKPSSEEYLSSKNERDGYERATVMLFETRKSDGEAIRSCGHAGLVSHNDEYWVVSVRHVTDKIGEENQITATFFGADGALYEHNFQSSEHDAVFSTIERQGFDDDYVVGYKLLNASEELMTAIANDEIPALNIVSVDSMAESQPLGLVSSSGDLLRMTFGGSNGGSESNGNFYSANLPEGKGCNGQSGSPIMVLDSNGNPTGDVVGLLTGVDINGLAQLIDDCWGNGHDLLFLPFNKIN